MHHGGKAAALRSACREIRGVFGVPIGEGRM